MCGAHLEHLERHASTICKVRCGCEANPLHTVACMAGAPQSDVAHFATLARAAPWSLPVTSPSMVSTGPSSLSAEPAHTAIDSSSGASSSIRADTREVVKVSVLEAPVTHSVDETMRFFAMAAAYGSRPPRPCRQSLCYCILVAGAACTALWSELATQRMVVRWAWRG